MRGTNASKYGTFAVFHLLLELIPDFMPGLDVGSLSHGEVVADTAIPTPLEYTQYAFNLSCCQRQWVQLVAEPMGVKNGTK